VDTKEGGGHGPSLQENLVGGGGKEVRRQKRRIFSGGVLAVRRAVEKKNQVGQDHSNPPARGGSRGGAVKKNCTLSRRQRDSWGKRGAKQPGACSQCWKEFGGNPPSKKLRQQPAVNQTTLKKKKKKKCNNQTQGPPPKRGGKGGSGKGNDHVRGPRARTKEVGLRNPSSKKNPPGMECGKCNCSTPESSPRMNRGGGSQESNI